jgi:hypothetical protein
MVNFRIAAGPCARLHEDIRMNYSKITEQIWVGSAISSAADVGELLIEVKPTRIIDCRAEFDDRELLQEPGLLKNDSNFYLFDGIQLET